MSVDPTQRRAPVRSVALIILGSIVGLIGLALLAGYALAAVLREMSQTAGEE